MEIKMNDELQKWLNKHVQVLTYSDDKKINQKWQKVLHEKIKQKLTSSVEPQATTELQERNNVKSNKTTKDSR
jgi:hypothetical protein